MRLREVNVARRNVDNKWITVHISSSIVGGGIRNPKTAFEKVKAGASIIVTGTVIEENSNFMSEFADAVHWRC